MSHAYIELLKVVERYFGLDGFGLVSGGFVGLAGSFELVELLLDGLVFYLFKEQFGLGQLMTGREQRGATELAPLKFGHVDEAAQLFAGERKERFEGDGEVSHELQ